METVGRFAPSPSGRIHLGNILCCLLAWLSARQKGGKVVLRIEDLDTARCPRRYAEIMLEDLRWLGLDWDEGPEADSGSGPYYQSERTALYEAALEKLRDKGLVLWGNALLYSDAVPLAAGHSDDISLLDDPAKGWGWLAEKGFDIIQTDWTLHCCQYLLEKGYSR